MSTCHRYPFQNHQHLVFLFAFQVRSSKEKYSSQRPTKNFQCDHRKMFMVNEYFHLNKSKRAMQFAIKM
uniref:Ovule protein n=1 Tax=Ascaris lumbricoides TaxID=6252 RepID=A0A0M3IXW7_ASCLU